MRKKWIMIFSVVVLLLVSVFTVNRSTLSKAAHPKSPQPGNQSPDPSDYVVYNFLFHKVVKLSEKTKVLRAQGRIGQAHYFPLQREARLTDHHAAALEAIASACWRQVAQQDEKAKAIINNFQSKFPGGHVPEGGSPPPPPELKRMWEERIEMILSARDQLRATLGEEEFSRFDNRVKYHYGTNKSPVTITAVSRKSKQN
jgi:hypothetical protein